MEEVIYILNEDFTSFISNDCILIHRLLSRCDWIIYVNTTTPPPPPRALVWGGGVSDYLLLAQEVIALGCPEPVISL